MSVLTVPYLVGALLLLIAGMSKMVSPDSTVEAARSAGLPAGRGWVQLMAGAEIAAGAAAMVVDSWLPALVVGLSYLGFAGFLARGLIRGDLDSCGCFAGDKAPPSWLHVAVDLGFALTALVVAAGTADASLRASYAGGDGLITTMLVLVASALAYVVLSRLPEPGTVPERLLFDELAGAR